MEGHGPESYNGHYEHTKHLKKWVFYLAIMFIVIFKVNADSSTSGHGVSTVQLDQAITTRPPGRQQRLPRSSSPIQKHPLKQFPQPQQLQQQSVALLMPLPEHQQHMIDQVYQQSTNGPLKNLSSNQQYSIVYPKPQLLSETAIPVKLVQPQVQDQTTGLPKLQPVNQQQITMSSSPQPLTQRLLSTVPSTAKQLSQLQSTLSPEQQLLHWFLLSTSASKAQHMINQQQNAVAIKVQPINQQEQITVAINLHPVNQQQQTTVHSMPYQLNQHQITVPSMPHPLSQHLTPMPSKPHPQNQHQTPVPPIPNPINQQHTTVPPKPHPLTHHQTTVPSIVQPQSTTSGPKQNRRLLEDKQPVYQLTHLHLSTSTSKYPTGGVHEALLSLQAEESPSYVRELNFQEPLLQLLSSPSQSKQTSPQKRLTFDGEFSGADMDFYIYADSGSNSKEEDVKKKKEVTSSVKPKVTKRRHKAGKSQQEKRQRRKPNFGQSQNQQQQDDHPRSQPTIEVQTSQMEAPSAANEMRDQSVPNDHNQQPEEHAQNADYQPQQTVEYQDDSVYGTEESGYSYDDQQQRAYSDEAQETCPGEADQQEYQLGQDHLQEDPVEVQSATEFLPRPSTMALQRKHHRPAAVNRKEKKHKKLKVGIGLNKSRRLKGKWGPYDGVTQKPRETDNEPTSVVDSKQERIKMQIRLLSGVAEMPGPLRHFHDIYQE